jgi:hypothetical protein
MVFSAKRAASDPEKKAEQKRRILTSRSRTKGTLSKA